MSINLVTGRVQQKNNIVCYLPLMPKMLIVIVPEEAACQSTRMHGWKVGYSQSLNKCLGPLKSGWPIYLQRDNVGGHGTTKVISEYTQHLAKNYDVLGKPLRSPETNALDLDERARPWALDESP